MEKKENSCILTASGMFLSDRDSSGNGKVFYISFTIRRISSEFSFVGIPLLIPAVRLKVTI